MPFFPSSCLRILFLAYPLLIAACTQPKSSTNTGADSQPDEEISGAAFAVGIPLQSTCGLFTNGAQHESFSSGGAEEVSIKALNTDLVVATSRYGEYAGGSTLVQLQGITSAGLSSFQRQKGLNLIRQLTSSGAYFVTGGDSCSLVVDGGGNGVVGQIYSLSGESVVERLLAAGLAAPRGDDGCGGDVLNACYAAIPVIEEFSPLVINHFLWKPVSDNDGRLVIGIDQFITVKVSGAISESQTAARYAGAPYVSFLRYSKPGCSYGNNIRIEFYDQNNQRLKTGNGLDHVTVASGCIRDEQKF